MSEAGAPHCDAGVFDAGVPVLGICYGMQLMTHALGGEVAPAPHREFGHATIEHRAGRAAVRDGAVEPARLGEPRRLRQGRAARASPSPRRAPTRRSRRWRRPIARLYALLFHPEVAHTDRGLDILRNFAFDVCGCTGDWTMASFVEEATARIRAQVGDGRVVCGLSGGVDSTVAAR